MLVITEPVLLEKVEVALTGYRVYTQTCHIHVTRLTY
jgi:hypothetical protein